MMSLLKSRAGSFVDSEDAVVAVEYAVLMALIGAVVITSAAALGEALKQIFDNIIYRLPDGRG